MNFRTIDLYEYDYIIYDCGYVHRLVDKRNEIIERLKDEDNNTHPLMFIADISWNRKSNRTELTCYPAQKDTDDVFQTLCTLNMKKPNFSLKGCVCFKQWDYDDEDALAILKSFRHCGMFGDPCKITAFETSHNKTVVVLHFDTENG